MVCSERASCLRLARTEVACDGTREDGGGTEKSRGGDVCVGVPTGVRAGKRMGVGRREGAGGCP